jgi:mono/diheme cytochrome c family protein
VATAAEAASAVAAPAAPAAAKASAADGALAADGKQLFDRHCASCHGRGIGNPGNARKPGTDALLAKYGGKLPPLLEERTDLTPALVAFYVRRGISLMAPYRKTEIDDAELAALGAWLSRGNPAVGKAVPRP